MKILMLAPKSFPVNGAEAIVNIKLLRALTEDGDISVDLISRKDLKSLYPSNSLESYGVKLNSLSVVNNKGGFSLRVLWQTICSLFIFKSAFPGCHWSVQALPIAKRLIENNHYDYVLTKSSPSFLLGAFLKKKGLKWVASWNDPFPVSFYPYPYGDGKHHKPTITERLMLHQMQQADYHVFPTQRLLEHMSIYLPFQKNRAKVIPHVVLNIKRPNHWMGGGNSASFSIIHSGNLGGARNPDTFFSAVESILAKNEGINLNITVLGKINEKDVPSRDKYPHLFNHLTVIPPVEYSQALDILNNFSMACVIEAHCKEGEAVFLPTKVTDFMQVGIPMLAVSPKEGVLHDLYKKGCIGYYGDVNDVESIKNALLCAWEDFINRRIKENVIDNSFKPQCVAEAYRDIMNELSRE